VRFPVVGDGLPSPSRGRPGELPARVWRLQAGTASAEDDRVAVEEPLEIRLRAGGVQRTLAVTMRTPGDDLDLAAGFLFAEGLIAAASDLRKIAHCDPEDLEELPSGGASDDPCGNIVIAELAADRLPDLRSLERHFFSTSACGVCGKAGLEALSLRGCSVPPPGPVVEPDLVASLPAKLRAAQGVFDSTGGLHAAALFDAGGDLQAVREDVGRHNAVDKLIGWALGAGRLPLGQGLVLVSGRSSYEILQKCLVAGVPIVCAVSAPSSLAVDLARRFGVTLVGFLRGERFNVYSRPDRIAGAG
jgi:FdhD protein